MNLNCCTSSVEVATSRFWKETLARRTRFNYKSIIYINMPCIEEWLSNPLLVIDSMKGKHVMWPMCVYKIYSYLNFRMNVVVLSGDKHINWKMERFGEIRRWRSGMFQSNMTVGYYHTPLDEAWEWWHGATYRILLFTSPISSSNWLYSLSYTNFKGVANWF